MKIVKCSKCGRYIHKADKCFHCGNMTDFEEVNEVIVHENVAQDYCRMGVLVDEKKFDDAISLSYAILEWMPNLAGVFWLRLLAKNKCTKAIELISKGFPCMDDPDFCNALRFSSGQEHSVYEDIQKAVYKSRQALLNEITVHEYKCKADTKIMDIKKGLPDEIDKRKKKLFTLWTDLERIEQSLFELEMDCRLLAKEHQIGIEQAAQAAALIKSETYRIEECTAEKLHEFQVRLGNALQQSESSKESLDSIKYHHPWVKSSSELVTKRNQQAKLIDTEISSLKSFERTVQQTITEIERIESCHKTARIAVDKYDFTNAAALLGTSVFEDVLKSLGIICGSILGLTFDKEFISDTTGFYQEESLVSEDEWSADDCYAAWELNND